MWPDPALRIVIVINNDKFTVYPSKAIEKVWNKSLGSTFQSLYLLKKTFKKNCLWFFYTINPERGLELKIILNASKRWLYA